MWLSPPFLSLYIYIITAVITLWHGVDGKSLLVVRFYFVFKLLEILSLRHCLILYITKLRKISLFWTTAKLSLIFGPYHFWYSSKYHECGKRKWRRKGKVSSRHFCQCSTVSLVWPGCYCVGAGSLLLYCLCSLTLAGPVPTNPAAACGLRGCREAGDL